MTTINTQEYIEVILYLEPWSSESAEIIEAELAELPYDSFMEDTDADGKAILKAYIPKAEYDARMLKLVLDGTGLNVSFKADLVAPMNWNAEWESNFQPIIVNDKITVKAPYHKNLKRSRFNITLDPKMAFGTGHHQTTYMMMENMLKYEDEIRGKSVMDLGCGTAVLGILAAKMKASQVYGIDIDAVAAQSGFDNARLNRMLKHMEIYCGDASLLQAESYDVLLANIHKNIILQDLDTYANSLRRPNMRYSTGVSKGGILMVSGFFTCDKESIIEAARNNGLVLISENEREDWSSLVFRRFVF